MNGVYEEDLKQQILQKVLNKKDGITFSEIAESFGVSLSTLSRWRADMSRAKKTNKPFNQLSTGSSEKRPEDFSATDKFEVIMQSQGLSDSELSALCRSKGIFVHHIEQWKTEFIQSANAEQSSPLKVKQLTQQNQKLNRELKRKDKALAEAAALLVLQKKVQDFWNDDEDG